MADEIILIVDDDRTTVRLCQRLLERASFQVITSMDSVEALRILSRQKIDLLLSDIRMPVMDGFELISRAKNYQPDLSVLLMTGYGSIENAIQALHRGVDGLILKPFENINELVQAVQSVLDESRNKRDAARLQALRPLFTVTEQLLAETSPHLLEDLILDTVKSIFQAASAGIFSLNAQNASMDPIRVTEQNVFGSDPRFCSILTGHLLKNEGPGLYNASGPVSDQQAELQPLLDEHGMESLMIAPVRQKDNRFVFCACRKKGVFPFTAADLEMFVILARQAGVAMENARLYSELKNSVHRIEESQRALVQAEKMAAVGRLMASLAHEINNPLQAVRNCLHLANRKGIENEQRIHYLEMTDNELERLVVTVRRMLDFYRPGGADLEKVDIHSLIDKVLAILRPQLNEQGIQVHFHSLGENTPVQIIPDQIQQVIFNILLNAMDAFEEPPGTYAVLPSMDFEIWIDVIHEEKQVRVLIEDSGPGVTRDMHERIFEPFTSTKEHGTGLGLAVSYGIMERHQGSLKIVPPNYKMGACFEMILPVGVDDQDG
jgi:signal transduction histidine kinase/CheY-like chemotaxis protein